MNGINPHDRMTAFSFGVHDNSHVKDGVELAKQYKLPMPVIDIISQHHGRTLVSFFYSIKKWRGRGERKRGRREQVQISGTEAPVQGGGTCDDGRLM